MKDYRIVDIANMSPGARAGHKLAQEMIRFLEKQPVASQDCGIESGVIDDEGRHQVWRTRPQRNIVLEYIDRCSSDRDKLEGFCAILSDAISSGAGGAGFPDADFYRHLLKKRQMSPQESQRCAA